MGSQEHKRLIRVVYVYPESVYTAHFRRTVHRDKDGTEFIMFFRRKDGKKIKLTLDEPDAIFLTREAPHLTLEDARVLARG